MTRRSFLLRQGVGFPGGTDGAQLRNPANVDTALRSDNVVTIGPQPKAFFDAAPLTYTSATLTWTVASNVSWLEIIIVASTAGHPITIRDGRTVTIVDASAPIYTIVDTNLKPGTWYYYSLFVRINDGINIYYQKVQETDTLMPRQYGNTDRLFNRLPEYYRMSDVDQNLQLYRYVDLIGYEMDYAQTLIETVRDIRSVPKIPVPALKILGNMLGIGSYADGISETRYRALCQHMMHLRSYKGTITGIKGFISALTGYQCDVTQVTSTRVDIVIYAQRVNLLKNPNFNTLGQWTVVAGGATVSAAANVVSIVNGTGAPTTTTLTSNSFPVLTGTNYSVGVIVNQLPTASTFTTQIMWNGTTPQAMNYLQNVVIGTTSAQRLTTDAPAAPAATTTGTLKFTVVVPAGQTVKLSQAILEPGPVGEWFDGDTKTGGYLPGSTGQFDFRWDSTIDASYSYYNLDYGRMKNVLLNAMPYIIPVGVSVGGASGYAITDWSHIPQ